MAMKYNGYKPKQRNSGTRRRKPVIFLIAEGKNKTETLYFKAFAQDVNRVIHFAPGNYTDPVNMVATLRDILKEEGFDPELGDKAYCLIDSDFNVSKDTEIEKADKIASEHNIEILVSAPCFEIWFLSHYRYSTKKYSSYGEIIADLQKHISGYKKGTLGIYETTKENLEVAIKNVKNLEIDCIEAGHKTHTVAFAPSSEVYKLAEELLAL